MDLDHALLEKRISLGCGSERTAQRLLNPESFLQCSENQHRGIERGIVNRSGHWSGSRKLLKFRVIFLTCIYLQKEMKSLTNIIRFCEAGTMFLLILHAGWTDIAFS